MDLLTNIHRPREALIHKGIVQPLDFSGSAVQPCSDNPFSPRLQSSSSLFGSSSLITQERGTFGQSTPSPSSPMGGFATLSGRFGLRLPDHPSSGQFGEQTSLQSTTLFGAQPSLFSGHSYSAQS